MKTIEANNVDLGRYAEIIVVLNNDEKSRKLADLVSELNNGNQYCMTPETMVYVDPLSDVLYVSCQGSDILTLCKAPEIANEVKKKGHALGAFSNVLDRNETIITFEVTVFYDLTMKDIVKHSTY